MATKFENLPCELIMNVIEFIDNPLSVFFNLNSNINRILLDHRVKLSVKIEDHHQLMLLPTNLTSLIMMNFKNENLENFQNLKSLTLSIDENIEGKLKLPSSLIRLKIHFNADVLPSLFNTLPKLKRLQTLIISNRKQSEVTFPLDSTTLSRNIKILQLKNIPISLSSIYCCEEFTELRYLELQLISTSDPFHYMYFTFPSLLKTLILQFNLSFTDLEYVLQGCAVENLKHLELYSDSKTAQPDYFNSKRWYTLFERLKNLTKCRIQLRQKGRSRAYINVCRDFSRQLKTIPELKTKWNMECYWSCPGYHGCVVYIQISANL